MRIEFISSLDADLTRWINSLSGSFPALDLSLVWISMIGIPVLVALVAGQWWARLDRAATRHVLVAAGFTFLLGLGLNQIIIFMFQRVRPYEMRLLVERSADPSFPSDHATAAFAIAAAFLIHELRGRGLAFLAAAVVLSFSRVYIGTHYVSDIAGGALTGLFAAFAVSKLHVQGSWLDRWLTSIL